MHENDDIVSEFLIESHENLGRVEHELLALETAPADPATLASIFRAVHTIKGTCGFLGFTKLERIAHVGESLLSLLRDEELEHSRAIAEGLLAMVDVIKGLLAQIEASGSDGDDDHALLIARLSGLIRGETPPSLVALPVPAPVPVPVPVTVASVVREPAPAPAAAPAAPSISDSSVRVDVALLDKLMNLVGELVLARNQVLQFAGSQTSSTFLATVQRLNLITTDLQEGVMKTRMQPIGNIFAKFPRMVRDLGSTCGKDIRLDMDGEDTELDRTLIEAIKDPLTHLVRNAVDHGIEDRVTRRSRGKPTQAVLSLRAYHAGGQVNIEITDDGNGIDCDKIRDKAIQRGILSPEQAHRASERELVALIFAPGFSTAAQITSVSGRGVGMDVVKTNIERIGGMVDVETASGKGTTFRVKIPLTLAIIPALIVACSGEHYAIPQISLLELVRLEPEQIATGVEYVHGAAVYRLRGRLLPLVDLRAVLGDEARGEDAAINIVVLSADDQLFGLIVDEIHDTADIVVKPLGAHLKGISAFAGATIMGDGAVALIIDVLGVAKAAGAIGQRRDSVSTELVTAVDSDETELLLCRGAGDGLIAIPLASVARLEKIAAASIERAGEDEVVQYRGHIMPMLRLSSLLGDRFGAADDRETLDVVVHGSGRGVGVVVGEILDIVHSTMTVGRRSTRPGVVGSLVVKGKVTELLDLNKLIEMAGLAVEADTQPVAA
jgi:two-component system, chemotaxis family, sensor kinase CheA